MQKYVNLGDVVKSFLTSIYMQKSALIQPRTSLSKFGGKFISLFIRLLTGPPDPRRGGDGAGSSAGAPPQGPGGLRAVESLRLEGGSGSFRAATYLPFFPANS